MYPVENKPIKKDAIALINGVLIDGTGSDPLYDAVVVIEDGLIKSVGKRTEVSVPDDVHVINMDGSFLLPGILNTHVHGAYNSTLLRAWLKEGVTTVCDLGGDMSKRQLFDYANATDDNPGYARIIS